MFWKRSTDWESMVHTDQISDVERLEAYLDSRDVGLSEFELSGMNVASADLGGEILDVNAFWDLA